MVEFLILSGIVLLISSQAENATEDGSTKKDADSPLHNRRDVEIQHREIRETHKSMFTRSGMPLF